MKFLFKYPTRGRPDLFKRNYLDYHGHLSGNHEYEFIVTIDWDDSSMEHTGEWLSQQIVTPVSKIQICNGNSKTKIEAVNADMENREFDILFLVSDDMRPVVKGFDDTLAQEMQQSFPDLDGALHHHCAWWNNDHLIVLSIMGRKMYDHFGYIYHPDYRSEYGDQEFTDVVYRDKKVKYFPEVLVKHDWIGYSAPDQLHGRNTSHAGGDGPMYQERKKAGYPNESVTGETT